MVRTQFFQPVVLPVCWDSRGTCQGVKEAQERGDLCIHADPDLQFHLCFQNRNEIFICRATGEDISVMS